FALKQAAVLEPRLPKLTITAAKPAPGLSVTRDGIAVDPGVLGTALYVDPGSHRIDASAPGYVAASLSVTLTESQVETVAIPELAAKARRAEPVAPVKPTVAEPTERPRDAAPSPTRKYLGIGGTVAGAVALGVGTVFAIKAHSTYKTASEACGSDLVCDSQS